MCQLVGTMTLFHAFTPVSEGMQEKTDEGFRMVKRVQNVLEMPGDVAFGESIATGAGLR